MAELNRMEYAAHTIHHQHSVLSAVLGKAVRWGHLRENLANDVDPPKLLPKKAKWVLTPEQAQHLLETLPPMPRTLVGLSLLTGMRRGEVLAVRWKSFEEVNGCISVIEAVYRNHFARKALHDVCSGLAVTDRRRP